MRLDREVVQLVNLLVMNVVPTLRTSSCEERVEWLQTELEKKTAMLMEVKRSLRETVDRERQIKELATDTEVGGVRGFPHCICLHMIQNNGCYISLIVYM